MIISDQHLHTSFSGDCDATPEAQIQKAVSLGLKHICITDHHDHDVVSDMDFELDIPAYMTEMNRLKDKYSSGIEISVGIELGLQEHIADYLYKTAEEYPFDFIIGSIHFIDGLDPYYPEYFKVRPHDAYEHFFDETLKRIKKTDCFDSLGHLDYIVRYGSVLGLSYSYGQFAEYIDHILRFLIEKGKALECNTANYAKGFEQPNPCDDVLKRYKELGGELITIGSDAHSPENLGCGFSRCEKLLKECGFKYYAIYRKRSPEMIKL